MLPNNPSITNHSIDRSKDLSQTSAYNAFSAALQFPFSSSHHAKAPEFKIESNSPFSPKSSSSTTPPQPLVAPDYSRQEVTAPLKFKKIKKVNVYPNKQVGLDKDFACLRSANENHVFPFIQLPELIKKKLIKDDKNPLKKIDITQFRIVQSIDGSLWIASEGVPDAVIPTHSAMARIPDPKDPTKYIMGNYAFFGGNFSINIVVVTKDKDGQPDVQIEIHTLSNRSGAFRSRLNDIQLPLIKMVEEMAFEPRITFAPEVLFIMEEFRLLDEETSAAPQYTITRDTLIAEITRLSKLYQTTSVNEEQSIADAQNSIVNKIKILSPGNLAAIYQRYCEPTQTTQVESIAEYEQLKAKLGTTSRHTNTTPGKRLRSEANPSADASSNQEDSSSDESSDEIQENLGTPAKPRFSTPSKRHRTNVKPSADSSSNQEDASSAESSDELQADLGTPAKQYISTSSQHQEMKDSSSDDEDSSSDESLSSSDESSDEDSVVLASSSLSSTAHSTKLFRTAKPLKPRSNHFVPPATPAPIKRVSYISQIPQSPMNTSPPSGGNGIFVEIQTRARQIAQSNRQSIERIANLNKASTPIAILPNSPVTPITPPNQQIRIAVDNTPAPTNRPRNRSLF